MDVEMDLLCAGTFNKPTCTPLPEPQYFGHYIGHWLSATAMVVNSTGNSIARSVSAGVVSSLAQAQAAWTQVGESGFLFPYSPTAFINLEQDPPNNCDPVCVPWYVYHKVLAGMIDQYQFAGNQQALQVAIDMALWAKQNIEGVLFIGGDNLWQSVLSVEWGGMNEALYNLAAITGDARHQVTAGYFNHWSWSAPLAANQDDLPNNHANTHIPEVIGDARGFEVTGNTTKHDIATNFFDFVNGSHSFATGGSSDHEYWGTAMQLGDQMDSSTEESCTQYNVLVSQALRHCASSLSRVVDSLQFTHARRLYRHTISELALCRNCPGIC
jgi:DUF1680 family protein